MRAAYRLDIKDTQDSILEAFFRQKSQEQQLMHGLIFTTPYFSLQQPIELGWAHTKDYVAATYTKDMRIAQLRERTQQGMYGNEGTLLHLTRPHVPPDCGKLINHTIKVMNEFWVGPSTS